MSGARVEEAARASYGRLLAILAARTGDIAAAEDALSDAFERALTRWPETGAPDKPEAWLLTVARNRWRDRIKSAAIRTAAPIEAAEGAALEEVDPDMIPDNRLLLMFVSAHPEIDAGVRAPLMLQTVLGLDAARIGAAFLVPAAAMAQRLVRAKAKIKRARIPFETPGRADMPARVETVLEAIYAAYALDWTAPGPHDEGSAAGAGGDGLTEEALYLADLSVQLMPETPEALGLAALLGYSHARRRARQAARGGYTPLDAQDPALWDRRAIDRAEALLKRAERFGEIGRFQLEAAIQSVHCARAPGSAPDWRAIAALYEGLVAIAPTIGAAVARAAAFGEAFGPASGLSALTQIDREDARAFQPYWAARAKLLRGLGDPEAAAAYERAISLCTDPAMRRWLAAEAGRRPAAKA